MRSGAWPGREFSEARGSGGRVGTNFAVFANGLWLLLLLLLVFYVLTFS